jgi:hypothetical protein
MPWSVRLRSFQRSGPGDAKCTRGRRPSTMLVGLSLGRFLSQRHVALTSPWPNCQGWMIWSGLRMRDEMMLIGFSRAIRGMAAPSAAHKLQRLGLLGLLVLEPARAADSQDACRAGGRSSDPSARPAAHQERCPGSGTLAAILGRQQIAAHGDRARGRGRHFEPRRRIRRRPRRCR